MRPAENRAGEDEVGQYETFRRGYGFKKLKSVVVGGDTRQQSVMQGLNAISDNADFIAIHDGARCLVTPEMIEKVLREAAVHGCATAAERPKDTIKRAGTNGYIEETIDRDKLWHAQTPQIFKADRYRQALAAHYGEFTDDCAMMEADGVRVKLVEGSYTNIKITTPTDLVIAQAFLTEGIL